MKYVTHHNRHNFSQEERTQVVTTLGHGANLRQYVKFCDPLRCTYTLRNRLWDYTASGEHVLQSHNQAKVMGELPNQVFEAPHQHTRSTEAHTSLLDAQTSSTGTIWLTTGTLQAGWTKLISMISLPSKQANKNITRQRVHKKHNQKMLLKIKHLHCEHTQE